MDQALIDTTNFKGKFLAEMILCKLLRGSERSYQFVIINCLRGREKDRGFYRLLYELKSL